jgi:4-amino-4-deoxy-L-arabinose transferase-like glycosyltransferase
MPTPVSESSNTVQQANGGVGSAAKSVAEHASAIARLEIELAVLELKKKVVALAVGIGMGIGAAILGLFGLGFVFLTIAAALATFLSTWLALLIVTLGLLTLAGLLGVLALGRIKKGTPPVPEQAIREAKLTTQALKH